MTINRKCGYCSYTAPDSVLVWPSKSLDSCICSKCVDVLYKIKYKKDIEESMSSIDKYEKVEDPRIKDLNSPRAIFNLLDSYVSGQDEAKKILATAIYNHIARTTAPRGVALNKSNVLLIGPTGSGKTYMLQILAKETGLPFFIADATTLSERGYVGQDVESVLTGLFLASKENLKRAETGIVYIDEIDKVAQMATNSGRDVSGQGVQKGLLKLIEGGKIAVPVDYSRDSRKVEMDTSNILFILGGAFSDMERDLVEEKSFSTIGFTGESGKDIDINALRHKITPNDLIKHGFMAELIGRCQNIAVLDNLTEKDIMSILVEKHDCLLQQYCNLFWLDGIKLNIEQEALDEVVKYTLSRNIGARGLKAAMELLLQKAMFERTHEDAVITKETAELYLKDKEFNG